MAHFPLLEGAPLFRRNAKGIYFCLPEDKAVTVPRTK